MISKLKSITSYILPHSIQQRNGKLTPYLEVVMDGGKLLLNTNKVNYSYGSLHDIFFQTFKRLNIEDRKIEKVLILGFGAGSIATLLSETFNKDCVMTGVEADEIVIELAEKHFNIDRFKNLTIRIADAYNFVLESKNKFDLIAVDIFVNDYTPLRFSNELFLSSLGNLLSPSGIICYNRMISQPKSKNEAEELIKSFDRIIGPNFLFQFKYGGGDNWMIVHDRASLIINPEFQKTKSEQFLGFKLNQTT